jgi:hypothetical protein
LAAKARLSRAIASGKRSHHRWGEIESLASPVRVGDPGEVNYRAAPRRVKRFEPIVTDLDLVAQGAFGEMSDQDPV